MFGSLKPPASLGTGYSKTNNGLRYLIAHAINSPIDSPHAPHGQASVNQGVAIIAGYEPCTLPKCQSDYPQPRVRLQCACALANQGGCHHCWNETLLALRFDAPLAISNPLACWVILARPGSECKCMHSGICLVDADKCTVPTRLLHVG